MEGIRVIDSHTAGEPTRVVISGGPDLSAADLRSSRQRLLAEFDHYRRAVVCEPRGSDVWVGAWLVPVADPQIECGVVFFNNVGGLGMCGHGTFGVIETLRHLGRIGAGRHRIATPVGVVEVDLAADGEATLTNVAARRTHRQLSVEVPGYGSVRGDVAWGGNWFFLTDDAPVPLHLSQAGPLSDYTRAIKQALWDAGLRGDEGAEIDHVEVSADSPTPGCDSRNFVLCPGEAYDRSPCGTGTSAKLACLAADGKLAPGQTWVQESICGGLFKASWQPGPTSTEVIPQLRARAWITAEATLLFDPADPFRFGLNDGA